MFYILKDARTLCFPCQYYAKFSEMSLVIQQHFHNQAEPLSVFSFHSETKGTTLGLCPFSTLAPFKKLICTESLWEEWQPLVGGAGSGTGSGDMAAMNGELLQAAVEVSAVREEGGQVLTSSWRPAATMDLPQTTCRWGRGGEVASSDLPQALPATSALLFIEGAPPILGAAREPVCTPYTSPMTWSICVLLPGGNLRPQLLQTSP